VPLNPHELSLHEPCVSLLSCPSFAPSAAYAVSLSPGCSIYKEAFTARPHGDNFFYPFFLRRAAYFPSALHSPWSLLITVPTCRCSYMGLRLQMPAIFILVPNVPFFAKC
jgi:hypothetical protein